MDSEPTKPVRYSYPHQDKLPRRERKSRPDTAQQPVPASDKSPLHYQGIQTRPRSGMGEHAKHILTWIVMALVAMFVASYAIANIYLDGTDGSRCDAGEAAAARC